MLSLASKSSFSGNLASSSGSSLSPLPSLVRTVRIASSAIAFVVAQSTSAEVSSTNLVKDHACHPENAQHRFQIPKNIIMWTTFSKQSWRVAVHPLCRTTESHWKHTQPKLLLQKCYLIFSYAGRTDSSRVCRSIASNPACKNRVAHTFRCFSATGRSTATKWRFGDQIKREVEIEHSYHECSRKDLCSSCFSNFRTLSKSQSSWS